MELFGSHWSRVRFIQGNITVCALIDTDIEVAEYRCSATQRQTASSHPTAPKRVTLRVLMAKPEWNQLELNKKGCFFPSSQLLSRYSWAMHITPTIWMCSKKAVKRSRHAEGWKWLILTSECAFSSAWKEEAHTTIKHRFKMKQNRKTEKKVNGFDMDGTKNFAEVGGNPSLKLISCPAEQGDWIHACAVGKPRLLSRNCQSSVRTAHLSYFLGFTGTEGMRQGITVLTLHQWEELKGKTGWFES